MLGMHLAELEYASSTHGERLGSNFDLTVDLLSQLTVSVPLWLPAVMARIWCRYRQVWCSSGQWLSHVVPPARPRH